MELSPVRLREYGTSLPQTHPPRRCATAQRAPRHSGIDPAMRNSMTVQSQSDHDRPPEDVCTRSDGMKARGRGGWAHGSGSSTRHEVCDRHPVPGGELDKEHGGDGDEERRVGAILRDRRRRTFWTSVQSPAFSFLTGCLDCLGGRN